MEGPQESAGGSPWRLPLRRVELWFSNGSKVQAMYDSDDEASIEPHRSGVATRCWAWALAFRTDDSSRWNVRTKAYSVGL